MEKKKTGNNQADTFILFIYIYNPDTFILSSQQSYEVCITVIPLYRLEITHTHTHTHTHVSRPFREPRNIPHACILSVSLCSPFSISVFSYWHHPSQTTSNPNSLQFSKDSRVPLTLHLLLLLSCVKSSSASQGTSLDPNQPLIFKENFSF